MTVPGTAFERAKRVLGQGFAAPHHIFAGGAHVGAVAISDSILVLYRAHLAEGGAAERVIAAPQHPYTQLLISAIPRAHVARDWLARENDKRRGWAGLTGQGCCYADRCPHATSACLDAPPALYRTEPSRAVTCVQFREHPALPASALGEVLRSTPAVRDAACNERFQRNRQTG